MGQILWLGVRAKTLARLADSDQALRFASEAVSIAESPPMHLTCAGMR